MRKLYREWCATLYSRKGVMLSPRGLKTVLKRHDTGYVSHYAFSAEDAATIKERGHSRHFDEFAVWANCLIIDIDSGDYSHVEEFLSVLRDVRLDVWSSGGKGFHVQVFHRWIRSQHLPYSHLCWVHGLGVSAPFDKTLFQHGRIVSLPGRVHPKTRKKKKLIYRQRGRLIDMPIVIPPEPTFDFSGKGDLSDLEQAFIRLSELATSEPSIGNRHTSLWGVASDLNRAGVSLVTVLELCNLVNGQWVNKKQPDEVEAAVQQAFSRRYD